MEIIVSSLLGAGLLLVGHLGVLVRSRVLDLAHGRDR
jgi:hypothetical protein